eukprot:TRINITY_DN43929_c0_g1_i1.p1 TRINITY_DN43929_c0_g1~~TRINITY_DN43929_c0_g1_i1.p1  ORF type:complete len:418 (-),score=58.52 TRINITY_DN43929_c0_g1_i1:176-1429(-)
MNAESTGVSLSSHPELDKFLAAATSSWSACSGVPHLTPCVLRQMNESFKMLPMPQKVACLLSFANAKGAHLTRSADTMQAIIDQAVIDPDQWVQGLARLLDGYPEASMIHCAKVDNEFLYRLTEVIDGRATTAGGSANNSSRASAGTQSENTADTVAPQASLHALPLTEDAMFLTDMTGSKTSTGSKGNPASLFDVDHVQTLFKQIEKETKEQLNHVGISFDSLADANDEINLDGTSPRRPTRQRSAPPVEILHAAHPSSLSSRSSLRSSTTRDRGGSLDSCVGIEGIAKPNEDLAWDFEGLEEAESAVVRPSADSPVIKPASPSIAAWQLESSAASVSAKDSESLRAPLNTGLATMRNGMSARAQRLKLLRSMPTVWQTSAGVHQDRSRSRSRSRSTSRSENRDWRYSKLAPQAVV